MTLLPAGSRLVEFQGDGAILRGFLFEHPGGPRPTVVMTHGLSATISGMVADRYAEVIHAAGLNVLLYDHPGFGLSGGEPRQRMGRWIQLRGYRDALDYVSALPSADPARLAVWGDSYSGGLALGVAAFDDRVHSVVVQVPACGSTPPAPDPDGATFAMHRAVYRDGPPPGTTFSTQDDGPVVSPDQASMPSILEPITAFRWFIDYGGRPGTGWLNRASGRAPDLPVGFHAGLVAAHLRGPSLWCVAADDEMPGAEAAVSLAAFDSAPEPKELLLIDGGHFGLLYHPSDLFDRVSAAQAAFLVTHLLDRPV
jgi:pimeloyl-ACP methyl ester carboxylesterase